ncbi:hypothetical protein JOD82_002310 [Paenibacillus sp. 1182]|uniref:hypothetical protein n=1 Tax=Paenibacillus sp. 1182 TaxID=2806565 RepID=UPI001AE442D2|nr:hypothetical protein [Paenibacillus sp. 1182]MBP1309290.1 hypothetical protein [Paenibacillus sp. 1182]
MIKKAILYIIGILVLGTVVSVGMSLLLSSLPFLIVTLICVAPFYGAIRRHKEWNNEALGMKAWLAWFMKVFKFGKPSLTFYLILGLAVYFVHEEIAFMLLETIMYAVGGAAVVFIVWESVRVVLSKKMDIPSFSQAIKGVW